MSVYRWWRAGSLFCSFTLHSVCLFVGLAGRSLFSPSLAMRTHSARHTHTHPFAGFEIWFLISSNITGSTAATHFVCAKWRNRSHCTVSNFLFVVLLLLLLLQRQRRLLIPLPFFFFQKHCCCRFWLPSYFALTFDAYVFLLAEIFHSSYYIVHITFFRVCVSFCVVCSSMKLHWFRNFIILHKIMSLYCLRSRSISSSSVVVPSAIVMNCESSVRDFSSAPICLPRISLFYSFLCLFFLSCSSPFSTEFQQSLQLFLNTHSGVLGHTKHQFKLIWFCVLDERD